MNLSADLVRSVPGSPLSAVVLARLAELKPIAAFLYTPKADQSEVKVHVGLSSDEGTEPGQLLCAVLPVAVDGELLDPSLCSWRTSAKLRLAYEYLPEMESEDSMAELRPLRVQHHCSQIVFVVKYWKEPASNDSNFIFVNDLFCSSDLIVDGLQVPILQAAQRL